MRSILLLLLPGAVAVLMQDPGTTLVTATTGENSSLTLACAGPKAAMTKILFASYGTPTGMGLSALIAPSCHSDTSIAVVETYCLQQPACNLRAHNDDFGDPCFGVGKRLTVTAECGLATQTIEPDAGAVVLAQNASENRAISLACDAPLVIARILFASYGTPTNVGLYAAKGKCDAANSTDVVSTACLSKAGCTVSATSSLFGNPCPKFDKQLTVTAECAASVISPTAAPYTSGGSAQGGGNTSPTTSATPMIIGVVCGIIVLVLCCVAGGIAWRRRSKPRPASPIYHSLESTTNRSEPKPYTLISNDTTGPSNPTTGPQDQGPVVRPFDGGRRHIYPSSFINLNVQPLLYHRLVLEDLRVTSKKPLASGAYGEVWLGVYGGQQVAIKRLKQRDPRSVQKFIEEIVLMSQYTR
ncbi:hypothetical protein SDRG_14507 [Saprolegnia diclina VS20]|uniref:SUEL-type lectin domain-containing protein n=1 Tax=Saprolegnia diclina (strain VS20) TaxID=1156394 RepID=T0R6S2_SAPDV|nr:hypothetical protein SDRG_14507 [Saprolegnia diclina VS20]EQC27758.1 hypothetical protein SDRG_14507 [Saprolegnia diclina VS20]|eukprot:XP_008618863.1 hypothetical protein SDRG_14507 [Saprolegnia diclina VS20]